MSEPFLAEIRIFGFNFPPRGWATCDGQILPINQNQSLFALIGTIYGGDGRTTFALPDLRGRTPISFGPGHVLGERAGEETHTLSAPELAAHAHTLNATADNASSGSHGGNVPARVVPGVLTYGPAAALVGTNPAQVANVGGGQAHQNMQPFMTLNFCIALQGLFPSRS